MKTLLHGGCACGQARFIAEGAPKRVGLCHCLTCRKAHASAFMPFAVFDADKVKLEGELKSWRSSPGYDRKFCPMCGSRVIGVNGGEVEISLGSLDAKNQLTPEYESWIKHREQWLTPLDAPQFEENRNTHTLSD